MAVTFDPATLLGSIVLSNGNLTATADTGSAARARSTIYKSTGKWYSEVTVDTVQSSYRVGISKTGTPGNNNLGGNVGTESYGYMAVSGNKASNADGGVAYGASYTTGDKIGILLDLDAGELIFWKNGVSQGVAFTGLSGSFTFAFSSNIASAVSTINHGATAFTHGIPGGYESLDSPPPTAGNGVATLERLTALGQRIAAGAATMQALLAVGGFNGYGLAVIQALTALGGGGPRFGAVVLQPLTAIATGRAASSGAGIMQSFTASGAGLTQGLNDAAIISPVPTLDASGETGSSASLSSVIPLPILEAGNSGASIDLLMLELDALLTVGIAGQFVGTLPILTNEATGLLSILATGNSTFPAFTLEAVGLGENQAAFSGNVPRVYTVAIGFSGGVAALAAQVPVLSLNAIGYGPYVGTAGLILEPVHLDADGFSAVAAALRTWVLNLRKKGLTEYNNFNFNSYAEYREIILAAGPAGIVKLSATNTDAGTAIGAQVRTGAESFGTSYNKRVPRIYVGYSTDGAMHFSTITSQDGKRTYLLPHNGITKIQQRRVPGGRGPKSPYWQYEFANVAGSDFLLEHVQVYPEKTSRRVV